MSTPQSQLAALLGAGIETLSLDGQVTFQQYTRTVLPLDGYVFWVLGDTLTVPGALHHTMEMLQHEDETLGLAVATFTTQQQVAEFADCPLDSIYVATLGSFRYAFSRQQGFFAPAQTWHYQGQSIYPAMASQLVDSPSQLDSSKAIVSNSLPIWLAFNGYTSPYVGGFSNPLTLYPSKLVPANLPPPYGSIHIAPEWTRASQSVPLVQQVEIAGVKTRVMSQLMADKVRIVLYGLDSDSALEFYGSLMEYIGAASPGGMGLTNMPAMTDGKREQVELQALAMQKVIEFDVSYQPYYSKAVALQTIKSASITVASTY